MALVLSLHWHHCTVLLSVLPWGSWKLQEPPCSHQSLQKHWASYHSPFFPFLLPCFTMQLLNWTPTASKNIKEGLIFNNVNWQSWKNKKHRLASRLVFSDLEAHPFFQLYWPVHQNTDLYLTNLSCVWFYRQQLHKEAQTQFCSKPLWLCFSAGPAVTCSSGTCSHPLLRWARAKPQFAEEAKFLFLLPWDRELTTTTVSELCKKKCIFQKVHEYCSFFKCSVFL